MMRASWQSGMQPRQGESSTARSALGVLTHPRCLNVIERRSLTLVVSPLRPREALVYLIHHHRSLKDDTSAVLPNEGLLFSLGAMFLALNEST
jgi:hypothetical protein